MFLFSLLKFIWGKMANLLVTGVAGFVGFHLCQRLLDRRDTIIGIDNLNNYYDVSLKQARLEQLKNRSGFSFKKSLCLC